MALSIQDSRILLKRSTNTSEVPTAAPSSDFTDGTWTSLDVYVGEAFANTVDEKLWLRFTNNIRQIAVADSPTTNRLTYWNASGHLGNVVAPTDGYYLKYTNASGYHWATAGGTETQTLSDVLALGNTSGANDILMNTTRRIGFKDGDNTNTSYISNNQTTGGSRTAYLPLFDGQLAYHATGVPLSTNYVLKGTTNGAITSSSEINENGVLIGIGVVNSDSFVKTRIRYSSNQFNTLIQGENLSGGSSAATQFTAYNGSGTLDWGILGTANSVNTTYGAANSPFIRASVGTAVFNMMYYTSMRFYDNSAVSAIPSFRLEGGRAAFNVPTATSITSSIVYIKGATSDSSEYALKVDNSSSSKLVYARNDGTIELYDGGSISLGTTTGVKIGIGTTDKLGFWNTTPIVQPTTGITAATFAANTSAIADDTATFDGYTIGQVVKALRNVGLLA